MKDLADNFALIGAHAGQNAARDSHEGSSRAKFLRPGGDRKRRFWLSKRIVDLAVCLLLCPVLMLVAVFVTVCNLKWNPGPLFYRQERMGRNGEAFKMIKFRSMVTARAGEARGHESGVERSRITRFGAFMRRHRIDELPQIINVLRGEMSLIGPRPDMIEHANAYCKLIPGYQERYSIRPGISGYAQVMLGYTEGSELAAKKTHLDHVYLRKASWRLELFILFRTLGVLRSGAGAA